ncbi:probable cytochrome P450 CYP44 isoform X1 [Cherax quadricarinatus]
MKHIQQYMLIQRCRAPWSFSSILRDIYYKWKPHHHMRYTSSASPATSAGTFESAKPFSAIPGPVNLPVIGTLFPYKIGIKKVPSYHLDVCNLYHKYGLIVKEVFGSQPVVHLFDVADIRAVYENDGKTPHIPPLQETSQFYRQQKNMSLGLGNLNGEEWYKLRHAVQQMMLRPREVSYYYPLQDSVARRAVDKVTLSTDDHGYISELHFLVGKWILESAGMCCFEKSLGCLSGGLKEDLAQKLVEANNEIFKLSAELKFSLRLYRYFKFPKYRRLQTIQDFFYGVSIKFIRETMDEIKDLIKEKKLVDGQFNFLTYLMSRKELSEKDVITLTLSLFSDGLSTTAPTLIGNLHCLALNPSIQERLYDEIKSHVDPDAPITVQIINKLHYLKAFVKEVFRFYPVGEVVKRVLQKDMLLSGYHVPAGTSVDLNAYIWLQSDHYFEDPGMLRPERWLRDLPGSTHVDPYVHNPFSIGTRMCAGRRFAEQDLYVGLCRLLLKFHLVATNNTPPQQEWNTLLQPKIPLPLQFIPRN